IEVTVFNRGPEAAALHLLPTLWFRNTWSWEAAAPRPALRRAGPEVIAARHSDLGERFLVCEGAEALLFTENETNDARLFGRPNRTPYVKDGIDSYVVQGRPEAVNPAAEGTKASAHYRLTVEAGGVQRVRLRLHDGDAGSPLDGDFHAVMRARRRGAHD